MSVDSGKELFRLGFLTAIEIPDRGYVGGLLVTNHFGRPLEFQCTAPLKPNRTQEILYGPTLVPYVLGDLIGRTLIEKVGVKPHLVLTERPELLGLRELVEIPVACVDDLPANGQAPAPLVDAEVLPSDESDETAHAPTLIPDKQPIAVVQPPTTEPVESLAAESQAADTGRPERQASITQVEAEITRGPAEASAEDTAERSMFSSGTQDSEPFTPAPEITPPVVATLVPAVGSPALDVPTPSPAENRRMAGELSDDAVAIQLGRQMLRFHAAHGGDRTVARRGARVVPNNADLREPFERVREALGETARLGGAR